jgi:hypothetical protein
MPCAVAWRLKAAILLKALSGSPKKTIHTDTGDAYILHAIPYLNLLTIELEYIRYFGAGVCDD